jgi:cyclic lactone autoinducer peptide
MKAKIFTIISAVVSLFALFMASTASGFWSYQPREPKCIRK